MYLGGKMLGVPGFGFQAFDTAASDLRAKGHTVFNPAERDRATGFRPPADALGSHAELEIQGFNRREALAADLAWIMARSEGMVCLSNWLRSPGTKAEIAAHQAIYLPVWELDDFLKFGIEAPTVLPLASGGRILC